MLEKSERELLYQTAKITTKPIVEIGSFFGASTNCLCLGSEHSTINPTVYSFDPHFVDWKNPWSKNVIQWAQQYQCKNKLKFSSSGVDFSEIFEKYTSQYKNLRHWNTFYSNESTEALPAEIGLLFLDLSKDWNDFIPILFGAFPRLRKESIIIFQDYGYKKGYDILAIASILTIRKYIKPISSAATSVSYKVLRSLDIGDIQAIITTMILPSKSCLSKIAKCLIDTDKEVKFENIVRTDILCGLLFKAHELNYLKQIFNELPLFLDYANKFLTVKSVMNYLVY